MNQIDFTRHVPALGTVQRLTAPAGSTVAQIVEMSGGGVTAYVRAPEPGKFLELPRDQWRRIRPKPGSELRIYNRLHGGGNGRILALVAAVTVAVLAPGIGNFAASALLGYTGIAMAGSAAFTLASTLFAGAAVIGGNYLISTLFAAEPQGQSAASISDQRKSAIENVDADANLLARDAYPPAFLGASRAALPDIVNPYNYLDDGVPTIEKLLAAKGPVLIEDVRADGVLVDDIDAITYEVLDGGKTTTTYSSIVTRYTSPVAVADELSNFALEDGADGYRDLEDQTTPANSAPIPVRFRTKSVRDMDEISFRLAISGMLKTSSPGTAITLPLRIRMRKEGDVSWINWPEVWITGIDAGTRLIDVRVRRSSNTDFGGGDIGGAFSYEFWREVPAVTAWTLADGSTGTQWTAHSNFSSGSGYQDVTRIYGRRQGIRAVLQDTYFPDGAYEFEVFRGIVTDDGTVNASYQISSQVVSLFVARSESTIWRVPEDQNIYQTRVAIQQATVIAEQPPCQQPGIGLVGIRSRGRSIRNVSAKCTGKVYDWGGSDWDTLTASSNPALVTRQVLADLVEYSQVGAYSRFSRIADIAPALLENTDWTGWKAQCTTMGATCSYVAAGQPVSEVLQRLLASGLARPAFGAKLRIDYFRDRSAEEPSITFSNRNATIAIKYFSQSRPMGIRATFRNADKEWVDDELTVRAPFPTTTGNWQGMSIEAISDPAWLKQRLFFDQLRSYYWRTQYTVSTDLEGIDCDPGTLVGLVTDLVDDRAHGARVRTVVDDQTLVIDQDIDAEASTISLDYSSDLADLFEDGEQSFVQVLTSSGSELKAIVDAYDTNGLTTIVLDTPLAATPTVGTHISIGSLSNRIRRCIVVEQSPGDEYATTLTLADEAPEIYATMSERFGW